MNSILESDFAELFGWSLLHFIWQGALIAAVVWLLLLCFSAAKSNVRYLICCTGLLLMVCFPIFTFLFLVGSSDHQPRGELSVADRPVANYVIENETRNAIKGSFESASSFAASAEPSRLTIEESNENQTTEVGFNSSQPSEAVNQRLSALIMPVVPAITFAWTVGVVLLSLKLAIGWFRVQQVQHSGVTIEDPKLVRMFDRLKKQLQMNVAVPLRASALVHSPMVVGWLKPVILLPALAISGLSHQQLSAILIHELAHIRRADFLVNLIQTVIETLLFYHPAVWWLSRRIRNEREHCCDDLVVAISGDRRNYVAALLNLEQSAAGEHSFAVSSNGGDLVNRIARILGRDRRVKGWQSLFAALTALTIVGLLMSGTWLDASTTTEATREDSSKVATEDEESQLQKMKLFVLSPDGQPVFNASITLGVWYKETAETLEFKTDRNGAVELPVPEQLKIYRVWTSAAGYTPLFANWEEDDIKKGDRPPKEFTFKMISAVEIGGVVVDGEGQPIEGVAVQVKGNGSGAKPEGRIRLSTWYALDESIKTDSDGCWSVANVPPGEDCVISLKFNHPNYISDEDWGDMQAAASIGLKDLRDKSAKLVMVKGIQVRGRVTDEAGKPIERALIVWGDSPYFQEGSQEIYTDADGRYETPTQKNGDLRITVMAPGYSPEMDIVNVRARLNETDFVMTKGNRLELRFVDEKGNAIPRAYAQIESWRSVRSIYNHRHPNVKNSGIPVQSDGDGVYVWDWAPEDEVKFNVSARDYIYQRDVGVIAGESPVTIVLKKPRMWSGSVVDSNGDPVSSFTVIPRLHMRRSTHERRRDCIEGKDGKFSIKMERQEGDYSLLIEADGYASVTTEKFPRDNPPAELKIEMRPAEAKKFRLVDVDGKAVPNATILAFPVDQTASLQTYFGRFTAKNLINRTSDSEGSFELPESQVPRTLTAITKEEFGEICDHPGSDVSEIVMQPWARLKSRVTRNGSPWLTTSVYRENRYHGKKNYHIQHFRRGNSDGEGLFQAKNIAPIPQVVDFFGKGKAGGLRYQLAYEPKPGEVYEIDFTNGCSLERKIEFSGNNMKVLDIEGSKFELRRIEPSVNIPEELMAEIKSNELEKLRPSEVRQWLYDRENFDAMRCYEQCFDIYRGPLTKTSMVKVDVLRPGKYELSIDANAKTNGGRSAEPLTEFSTVIEIASGKNELAAIEVPVLDDPLPGSTVGDFEFAILNSQTDTNLERYRGKYVLLDFWMPWCDKCKEDTAKVHKLAKMIARSKKTTLISLMANGNGPLERVPSKIPDGLTWIDGQVSVADERLIRRRLGAWNSQHFVLIDPAGNFVVGGTLAKVAKEMEKLGLK